MKLRTTNCSVQQHAEFCLSYDPDHALEADVHAIKAFIERSVERGLKYRQGETLQVGWMLTSILERSDGDLGIAEPDFASIPINWTESVTRTAMDLRLQRDVCESFGLSNEVKFPSILNSAIIATDVPRGCEELILARTAPEGTDSGWFVGKADSKSDYNDPSCLRRCSLYEVGMWVPASIKFLALPKGCEVTLEAHVIQCRQSGRNIEPSQHSFVEQWQMRGGRAR